MAENELDIAIRTSLEATGAREATKELGKVKEAAKSAGEEGKQAGEKSGAGFELMSTKALAAKVSVAAVAAAFTEALTAAAESEAAQLKLNTSLAATGQLTPEVSANIQELATQYQHFTNVSDETWTMAAAKLVQFGAKAEDIKDLFPILEGLAGRMGGDVTNAAQALARALAGNTRELNRFGADLKEGASRAEVLAAASKVAAAGQGQLRNETLTLGGAFKTVKTEIGDLFERLGGLINYSGNLTYGIDGLGKAIRWLTNLLPEAKDNTVKLAEEQQKAAQTAGELKQAMGGVAAPTRSAGEAAKESAVGLKELAQTMDEVTAAANRMRAAEDALADAQADLDIAKVDRDEAQGNLSKGEAAAERARLRSNADRTKAVNKLGDTVNEQERDKTARDSMQRGKDLAEEILKRKDVAPADRAEKEKQVEELGAEIERLDRAIDERSTTIEALRAKLQAVNVKAEKEQVDAAKTGEEDANDAYGKIAAETIRANEEAAEVERKADQAQQDEYRQNRSPRSDYEKMMKDEAEKDKAAKNAKDMAAKEEAKRKATRYQRKGIDARAKEAKGDPNAVKSGMDTLKPLKKPGEDAGGGGDDEIGGDSVEDNSIGGDAIEGGGDDLASASAGVKDSAGQVAKAVENLRDATDEFKGAAEAAQGQAEKAVEFATAAKEKIAELAGELADLKAEVQALRSDL